MLFRMDEPVGCMIGNSLEILESIDCMQGGGPEDLIDYVSKIGNVSNDNK